MKNLKISTSEIAKICNVSQGTVDRALNSRPDIKAETKQKILEVARRYGYREKITTAPEKIAGQIGVVIFNLNNEYFAELITELEYALGEQGFCTTVMMSHYDAAREIECIRNLYNMGVEGIVLCAVNNGSDFQNFLKLLDVPIVAIGNRIDGIPFVGVDDFVAMQDMTKYALAEGKEQIIYFLDDY